MRSPPGPAGVPALPDTAARLRLACRLQHRENALISLFNALPAIDLSLGNGSVN